MWAMEQDAGIMRDARKIKRMFDEALFGGLLKHIQGEIDE
jgi:hypothetical protein